MASTLLLDRSGWDLCLTASLDLAVATEPYSQVQDVASECRVFAGECYYDTTRGIAYRTTILGQDRPIALLKQDLTDAALLVPGVTSATVYLNDIQDRSISGQVQIPQGVVAL